MNSRIKNWRKQIDIFSKNIDYIPNIMHFGRVVGLFGSLIEAIGLNLPIDTLCIIECKYNQNIVYDEAVVMRVKSKKTFLMLLKSTYTIFPGARVFPKFPNTLHSQKWPLGFELLGRVLDSQGKPLDHRFLLYSTFVNTLQPKYINPLDREPIHQIFDVGIRAINTLLTLGKGQKIGLFSKSGYGKSILLGMIARYAKVDIVVIGLIGERGREIRDFIEHVLGVEGLVRSVIVAVPINTSPILKIQGAMYAMRIAEYFRDQKKDVLLILDSLTRYAMSEREISIALGEIPINQGYSSSIFTKLPNFIERAGNLNNSSGSITAFYTILLEYEENDLIAEIAKSVLDGHIILSKMYSDAGHYPAIDIVQSMSRLMVHIVNTKHYTKACYLKQLIAIYHKSQDLIDVGAYINGTNRNLDIAIQNWSKIQNFLQQDILEPSFYKESLVQLNDII